MEKAPDQSGAMMKQEPKNVDTAMNVPPGAIKYAVDPNASKIEWSSEKKLIDWKHNGTVAIKSGDLYKVTDSTKGDLVMGMVIVDMNSIVGLDANSNPTLIGHLKSPDFFDVATYPTATLQFTAVPETPGSVSDKPTTSYKATGMLTIHGKSNPVEFTVTSEETPTGMVTGTTDLVVDRTKYDVKFGSQAFFSLEKLGNNLIVDEIPLKITLQMKKS